MIEKIFIVFVIMECIGLMFHITDSIRCWGDRIYYRKHQEMVDKSNEKNCIEQEHIRKTLENYTDQVSYISSCYAYVTKRLDELEKRLPKPKTKKPINKNTKKENK